MNEEDRKDKKIMKEKTNVRKDKRKETQNELKRRLEGMNVERKEERIKREKGIKRRHKERKQKEGREEE